MLRLPAISLTVYGTIFFLSTLRRASAQTFLGPIEESCGFRKAEGVMFKLLAVYASHILTIKIPPGARTATTIKHYFTAALLPSASSFVTILDLFYRRSNFHALAGLDRDNMSLYKNMQKAINAGAVCERIDKQAQLPSHTPLADPKVRAPPLRRNEEGVEVDTFIMVPRGTDARMFVPTMIEGNSQHMKALVGVIQLGFATLQLVSAADAQVAAYGYGAYIYTIIPYAIGSAINLIGALFTESYVDLTEMVRRSGTTVRVPEVMEQVRAVRERVTPGVMERERVLAVMERVLVEAIEGLLVVPARIQRVMTDDDSDVWFGFGVLQVALYLAIVGGCTHFQSGISSRAQRGWFVSWALVGSIYGLELQSQTGEGMVIQIMQSMRMLCVGAASIGGVVAMIQQYLHLYQC